MEEEQPQQGQPEETKPVEDQLISLTIENHDDWEIDRLRDYLQKGYTIVEKLQTHSYYNFGGDQHNPATSSQNMRTTYFLAAPEVEHSVTKYD